jgi:hypothetical protein
MTHGTSLEVREGEWVHVQVDGADNRSPEQQTRDRLLRDLALAFHYDRVLPTQGEQVPGRRGDAEPYASRVNTDGEHTASVMREIRALLGEPAVAEFRAAAEHLADTKPGQ